MKLPKKFDDLVKEFPDCKASRNSSGPGYMIRLHHRGDEVRIFVQKDEPFSISNSNAITCAGSISEISNTIKALPY